MNQNPELVLLLKSFERNGRVNQVVLDTINETDFDFTDGQGSYSIGQHLGHLAEFRYEWLSQVSPKHAENIPSVLDGDENGFHLTAKTTAELKDAFVIGDAAAKDAVLSALDEGRSFSGAYESHPAQFLQHIIVHDSHHRGQIMTLLRKSRQSTEQTEQLEKATWPTWREYKQKLATLSARFRTTKLPVSLHHKVYRFRLRASSFG